MIRLRVLSLILVLLAVVPASADELRIGQAAPATSVDPHFYNAAPNNGLEMHIFDRLTERSPEGKLRPGLAVSWVPVADTVWDFRLRQGVTFQDGKPLTADDIVFTLSRVLNVPNSPGGFAGMVRAIRSIDVVDPQTLRIHTAGPAPNLPGDLASVAIISRHAGQGATTEDYNSGKAAIGTGPYKLVRYVSGDRVELVRNEAWWGEKPEWDRVTIRFIPNAAARVAALLAGDVDIIDVPPAADLPRLKADPKLSIFSTQGQRMIFIHPDSSRTGEEPFVTDNDGNKLAKNPFLDLRVRQALSFAINREALASRVMEGTATPTGQWLPPGTYSYDPAIKVPPYDPARAKALLAEASFPHGFKLTLHTPNDRYPNDSATAQAVAQMWTRVGIATAVQALPWSTYSARGSHQEWSIGLWGWGTNTGEAGYTLINVLGTFDPAKSRGASNQGRYSNPALDALTDRALSTIDDTAREALLRQAEEMAMNDVGFIPLYQLINYWATRKGVTYEARGDERSLAFDAHHAKK
jgi:peptide/nickel transport system substrate-binding protein